MEENDVIKQANEKLEEISNDEIMQRIAEWKADGIRIENGRKRKYEKNLKEATEQASKKGRAEGSKNAKIEIAKKLKKENMDIKFIANVVGLSEEEIKKL